ncbi:hypothetical protein AVEN_3237-1 [Araneus ventricosus]|uniref:Uncharacterized protein n=1 Tax=Araneus ventricosus TaxID=182803 RepID=A0A4Y2GCD6_ARAVE|nr:hypothetical protein AVEN_3237-1 [Araneus ventricosus]
MSKFSLVTLTSISEETRGLLRRTFSFCTVVRLQGPQLRCYPLQASTAGHLATVWRVMSAIHGGSFGESGFGSGALRHEIEILPLGHCGRLEWLKEDYRKHNNSDIKRKHFNR